MAQYRTRKDGRRYRKRSGGSNIFAPASRIAGPSDIRSIASAPSNVGRALSRDGRRMGKCEKCEKRTTRRAGNKYVCRSCQEGRR